MQFLFIHCAGIMPARRGVQLYENRHKIPRRIVMAGQQVQNPAFQGMVFHYSPIRIAQLSTVVHMPRLSPIADWVIFSVRTILFEMR